MGMKCLAQGHHRRWREALNFVFRKKRDCIFYEAKTKALISCVATAQLICAFVFAYAKSRFFHDVAQSHFRDIVLSQTKGNL